MGIQVTPLKKNIGLANFSVDRSGRKKQPNYLLLPYTDILEKKKGQPIHLKDGTYADMLNLPGKDLDFLNADGDNSASEIIGAFHVLLTTFVEDFDIKISQLPADTRMQQSAWGQELVRVEAQLQQLPSDSRQYAQLVSMRQFILREINLEKNVVGDIKHQEYTAVIYGKTIPALDKNRRDFIAQSGAAFSPEPVTLERKKMILYQINNPGENLELEEK
ncbi:hypothetical protein [Leuconostoc gasicomitatum]|uniref:hypothetical protein n=1 Tax=Leuconostoc gasicomitatum TaxID=115778 RepID=UPI0007E025C7|nr:hypothetical protein [Leuconostoc gasicomitatum]CUW11300.1 hypothetical protein PB1E_1806 [Leuconostoc gasicomitatum]